MTTDWMNTKEYFVTYSIMINAAQHFGLCTYQEIAQAIGISTAGNYMGSVVGELIGLISRNEIEQGRPMLSSIVFGVTGKPGAGYFAWAKDLGLFKEGDDEMAFWESERMKVYESWKIHYKLSKGKN